MQSRGPETRYARTVDGLDLAYQVYGDGPIDLLVVPGAVSHVGFEMEQPSHRYFCVTGRWNLFSLEGR